MTKTEELLQYWKYIREMANLGQSPTLEHDDLEAIDGVISALEKQIPKKPIIAKETTITFLGAQTRDAYYCSVCKEKIRKLVVANKFCHNCGQAVDFEEVE